MKKSAACFFILLSLEVSLCVILNPAMYRGRMNRKIKLQLLLKQKLKAVKNGDIMITPTTVDPAGVLFERKMTTTPSNVSPQRDMYMRRLAMIFKCLGKKKKYSIDMILLA